MTPGRGIFTGAAGVRVILLHGNFAYKPFGKPANITHKCYTPASYDTRDYLILYMVLQHTK